MTASDPMEALLGKICVVITDSGYNFAARMISIRYGELHFENRRGQRLMVARDCIKTIRPAWKQQA